MNYIKRKIKDWPDLLAALSNILFTVALWPSVVVNNPPEASTSLMTFIALVMLSAGMLKRKMYLGVFFQAFCMVLWLVLFIQGLNV